MCKAIYLKLKKKCIDLIDKLFIAYLKKKINNELNLIKKLTLIASTVKNC